MAWWLTVLFSSTGCEEFTGRPTPLFFRATGSVSAGALQTRAEGVADYWKYSKAMTARRSGTAHAKLNGNLAADMKRRTSGSSMPE